MYITISPQKLGKQYSQSAADFVGYLEKENKELPQENHEYFFNQFGDGIPSENVIKEIDANTAKLKKREPKFYSITVNPSKYELKQLKHTTKNLKEYTQELMKVYAASFNREINGRPISITDIKYFAKIEHQRKFKGTDKEVQENQKYATKILQLKNEIRNAKSERETERILLVKKQIAQLEQNAPHKIDGKRIVQGMLKPGNQSHIHIIVSRKDASNSYSLSPGSKHKASEVEMHGKIVKRGFDRDNFFMEAEKIFDKTFSYQRNYAETYKARKNFINNPQKYFAALLKLPANEKALAFKILNASGTSIVPSVPINKAQIALRVLKRLKRGAEIAINSSSIGI